MSILKIGIVGCGAIGSSLARTIKQEFFSQAKVTALFDTQQTKAKVLSRSVCGSEKLAVKAMAKLIQRADLVVEAASAGSSKEIAKAVLTRGRDIMIMSVGGILNCHKELSQLARRNQAKVYIPSGAICGIDALKAAREARLKKVTLVTRKNPRSFKGVKYLAQKGIKLEGLRQDKILFCGTAAEAVRYFPQNINVAAVLSLAGMGKNQTRVKIIASASTKNNTHEIIIDSRAARIVTRTENALHPDNPKTSYLAVLSAAATLRQILEPIRIGT